MSRRTTSGAAIAALMLAVVLAPPPPAASTPGFARTAAVELFSGMDAYVFSGVSDGTYAYFATNTDPAYVVKVELATMTRVGTIEIAGGSELGSAISDGTYAYFSTTKSGTTATIVKIRLNGASCAVGVTCGGMEEVGAIEVEAGVEAVWAAVREGAHAYFGTYTDPSKLVKVLLDGGSCATGVTCGGMERVGAIPLSGGYPWPAVSDGTHAYFGSYDWPGKVVKVRLDGATCAVGVPCGGMAEVGAIELAVGDDLLATVVSDGSFAYFGTESRPGRVVKVRLDGASCAPSITCGGMQRVGALDLEDDEGWLYSAARIGSTAFYGTYSVGTGHVRPARVVEVDLATMRRVGAIVLEADEDDLTTAVIDEDSVYFVAIDESRTRSRVVRIDHELGPRSGVDDLGAVTVGVASAQAAAAGVAGSVSGLRVRGSEVLPVTVGLSDSVGPRGGVVLQSDGMQVRVASELGARAGAGVVVPSDGVLEASVSGGLVPGSVVEVWINSMPRLVAAAEVPADGGPVTVVVPVGAPLDGGGPVEDGAHTLELRMFTTDGFEVVATGITIGPVMPTGVPAGEGPEPSPSDVALLMLLGVVTSMLVAMGWRASSS